MTKDELRAQFEEVKKVIQGERRIWVEAGARGLVEADGRVRELDRLQEIMVGWKDELKRQIESEPVQPRMIDAPRRESYG